MATDFANEAIQYFTGQIAEILVRASTIAKAAATLSDQGLTQNAIDTLYDAETLIFDASTLLNAASYVRRQSREVA